MYQCLCLSLVKVSIVFLPLLCELVVLHLLISLYLYMLDWLSVSPSLSTVDLDCYGELKSYIAGSALWLIGLSYIGSCMLFVGLASLLDRRFLASYVYRSGPLSVFGIGTVASDGYKLFSKFYGLINVDFAYSGVCFVFEVYNGVFDVKESVIVGGAVFIYMSISVSYWLFAVRRFRGYSSLALLRGLVCLLVVDPLYVLCSFMFTVVGSIGSGGDWYSLYTFGDCLVFCILTVLVFERSPGDVVESESELSGGLSCDVGFLDMLIVSLMEYRWLFVVLHVCALTGYWSPLVFVILLRSYCCRFGFHWYTLSTIRIWSSLVMLNCAVIYLSCSV